MFVSNCGVLMSLHGSSAHGLLVEVDMGEEMKNWMDTARIKSRKKVMVVTLGIVTDTSAPLRRTASLFNVLMGIHV